MRWGWGSETRRHPKGESGKTPNEKTRLKWAGFGKFWASNSRANNIDTQSGLATTNKDSPHDKLVFLLVKLVPELYHIQKHATSPNMAQSNSMFAFLTYCPKNRLKNTKKNLLLLSLSKNMNTLKSLVK